MKKLIFLLIAILFVSDVVNCQDPIKRNTTPPPPPPHQTKVSSSPKAKQQPDFRFSILDENAATAVLEAANKNLSGSIEIPETTVINGETYSVTSIGKDAFVDCKGITSITIPNSVTSIGQYAFSGCTGLKNVTMPDSVIEIGNFAFNGCIDLTSITLPPTLISIGEDSFRDCNGLMSTNNPDLLISVLDKDKRTAVIEKVNKDASGNIIIPERVIIKGQVYSVTTIGKGALGGCKAITSITIPNSVSSINPISFIECKSLTKFLVNPDNPFFQSKGGLLYSKDMKTLIRCPAGLKGKFVIPYSVTAIGNYAFSDCTGLTHITIPDSVTTFGEDAFSGCSGLTNLGQQFSILDESKKTVVLESVDEDISGDVLIPKKVIINGKVYTVTKIGSNAFMGLKYLFGVRIPNSITEIGGSAFTGCERLERIALPESVTRIGFCAFEGCVSLISITIPNSVTEIEFGAFKGCERLESITIPDSVTKIEPYTFKDCTDLKRITLPNSVTEIGRAAFYNCFSLGYITIPNSVKSIGEYAFRSCDCLRNITIPDSVTRIEVGAFKGSGLNSITIPDSVTYIGEEAFNGCIFLEEINIPAKFLKRNGKLKKEYR